MWLIAKWKEFNKQKAIWEVFYSAVPESWVDKTSNEPMLMWPMYSSGQKDRREGNPITGEAEKAPCIILARGFKCFDEANKAEKKWYDSEKNKSDLTTEDSETDNEDDDTPEHDSEDNNSTFIGDDALQKNLSDLLEEENSEKRATGQNSDEKTEREKDVSGKELDTVDSLKDSYGKQQPLVNSDLVLGTYSMICDGATASCPTCKYKSR